MFRTELNISPSSFKLNHSTQLLTIGSCFSQVIGERLLNNKFATSVNPFGTIFNPVSIAKLLESSLLNDNSLTHASVENKGVWFNHHVHSDFYGMSKDELNSKLTDRLKEINLFLKDADTIIITLGTA